MCMYMLLPKQGRQLIINIQGQISGSAPSTQLILMSLSVFGCCFLAPHVTALLTYQTGLMEGTDL